MLIFITLRPTFYLARQLVTFYLHFFLVDFAPFWFSYGEFQSLCAKIEGHPWHLFFLSFFWMTKWEMEEVKEKFVNAIIHILFDTIVITLTYSSKAITTIIWHFKKMILIFIINCCTYWLCSIAIWRISFDTEIVIRFFYYIFYCWYIMYALDCRTMPNSRVKHQ